MTAGSLDVLYEDNHLLAVAKPAGLPTMGVAAERASLVRLAKNYLKHKYHKPGNVYLGVVSRLDAAASGVIVLARTSKAAARLSEAFRRGDVKKTYWALVEGHPEPPESGCLDWLVKDERHQRMMVCRAHRAGARQARLHYRTQRRLRRISLLEIDLDTGRKHQIRVQLAERGHPILGDAKYGARLAFPAGIALHAWALELDHPIGKTRLRFTAPSPSAWRALGVDDGFA